jgi:Tfp pilus assembly protein PilO
MNSSNPRFWLIGGILTALLLAALSWTFIVGPRMQAVAQTREQAIELDDQATLITAQAHQLQVQAQSLPEQIRALQRIQRKIPSSVDVPALLRDIQRTAKDTEVTIITLTPGQITVFSVEEPEPVTTQDSTSDEAQPSPDPTQVKPEPTPTDLGQGKLPQGVGLSYVPLTIVANGAFSDLQRFTARVENLQRAFLITGVQLARATGEDTKGVNPLQMTLDTHVFVANDRLRDLPDQALQQMGGQ